MVLHRLKLGQGIRAPPKPLKTLDETARVKYGVSESDTPIHRTPYPTRVKLFQSFRTLDIIAYFGRVWQLNHEKNTPLKLLPEQVGGENISIFSDSTFSCPAVAAPVAGEA